VRLHHHAVLCDIAMRNTRGEYKVKGR
jgi:hypothetical protein